MPKTEKTSDETRNTDLTKNTKNAGRSSPKRSRDRWSHSSSSAATSSPTGSLRLRPALESTTSMERALWSTCPTASLPTSRVRSPQQAMSMKNARDCHAHGDGDSNVPAARRNRAASRSVSRYGVGRGDPAFHWSESTYASGSWASRIHLPKSLMYENHERQPPGFASILWAIHRSTTPRSRRTAPCSRQCRSNERRTRTRVAPCLPMDALKRMYSSDSPASGPTNPCSVGLMTIRLPARAARTRAFPRGAWPCRRVWNRGRRGQAPR